MLLDDEVAKEISAWADIVSMFILAVCFVIGGLSPCRKVWGWPPARITSQLAVFSIAVIWSVFRFIVEGIFKEAGPREFLTATIFYLGRWVWLYWRITRPKSKYARVFKVARALRNLQLLRVGFSSDPEKNTNGTSAWEVVLRKGVASKSSGKEYWRGNVVDEHYCSEVQTWQVHLVERKLHATMLDSFGTIEYLDANQKSLNAAYQAFYEVAITAVGYRPMRENESSNETPPGDGYFVLPRAPQISCATTRPETNQVRNGSAEVNFTPFFARWSGLPVQWIATMVGADDLRPIGWVARRVAADAISFINTGKHFRTEEQVEVINQCLRKTLQAHFREDSPADVKIDI